MQHVNEVVKEHELDLLQLAQHVVVQVALVKLTRKFVLVHAVDVIVFFHCGHHGGNVPQEVVL